MISTVLSGEGGGLALRRVSGHQNIVISRHVLLRWKLMTFIKSRSLDYSFSDLHLVYGNLLFSHDELYY